MDAQTLAEVEFWLDRQAATTSLLTDSATAGIAALFAALGDWNDPAETLAAAAGASEVAMAAQAQGAGATSQWLALALAAEIGSPVALPGSLNLTYPREGVSPFDVYSRPIFDYRDAASQGASPEQAFAAALSRAQAQVETDMALAKRRIAQESLRFVAEAEPDLRIAYRRAIRPELSKSGTSCGLCIAASTRWYSVEDLMPIHSRCNCEVVPSVGAVDPGRSFNEEDLSRLYTDADSTSGSALKRTRYSVIDDPELGALLNLVGGGAVPRASLATAA